MGKLRHGVGKRVCTRMPGSPAHTVTAASGTPSWHGASVCIQRVVVGGKASPPSLASHLDTPAPPPQPQLERSPGSPR